jgi:hypothetical protein
MSKLAGPAPAKLMLAGLCDREKSLTTATTSMGAAFPARGATEVLSFPLLLAPWVKA